MAGKVSLDNAGIKDQSIESNGNDGGMRGGDGGGRAAGGSVLPSWGDSALEGVQHPCSNPPALGLSGLGPQEAAGREIERSLLLLFFTSKRGAKKTEKNKIVFSSVLESTWINNGSRNWAAETINFLWTQPKKDAGRRWLPSPCRQGKGTGSGTEVNKGGPRWGRGGRLCFLLSKCINSKHMLAADTAQAAPRAELAGLQRDFRKRKEGPQGWREVPRAPALGRALEAAASQGDPAAPHPNGAEDPPTWPGPPPPHFVWVLGGSSPPHDARGALPPASRHAGLFRTVKIIVPTLGFC